MNTNTHNLSKRQIKQLKSVSKKASQAYDDWCMGEISDREFSRAESIYDSTLEELGLDGLTNKELASIIYPSK